MASPRGTSPTSKFAWTAWCSPTKSQSSDLHR
jgi:hypothetical protein